MAEVTPRERRFLAAGAAALLLAGGGLLVQRGGVDLGTRSRALLPEKEAVLRAFQEAVGREAGLERESADLESRIAGFAGAFLPGATPPLAAADLQTRLKELADRAGMKIQSEKILAHARREAYLEIPVQIVATGEMRNLSGFILAVEQSPVFIAIKEMSLRTVKRRQFVPETRTYLDVSDIQANMTLVGLIPG